jgi:PiT family inorganic phosphate transporter
LQIPDGTLTVTGMFFLALALGLALAFEFVNGFHDTANAVATVIYTRTLRANVAVIWSGIWNLIGVLTSSGAVAFGVVALLPVELVLNVGTGAGFAMVFALLLSSMIWNLGTWFLGLPASSSHTLIGSIMGVGLANSVLSKGKVFGEGVNWAKAGEVGSSLLFSPIVGFCGAALLLLMAKLLVQRPELYRAPSGDTPPPLWIRLILMLTCTGVSFAHGSNDGQKGMGLIMLILIGILPGVYALNSSADATEFHQVSAMAKLLEPPLHARAAGISVPDPNAELSGFLKTSGTVNARTFAALEAKNQSISVDLAKTPAAVDRRVLRTDIYLVGESLDKLLKTNYFSDPGERALVSNYSGRLRSLVNFIPDWVKTMVAITLGLGTMIGWKRIVVTVGERIGKEHLSYAQGASAELMAMMTIIAADGYGVPVSTTHVLSSGVAGAMAANASGLQMQTVRNLLLAWVLTLPVCVLLGATMFAASLYLFLHVLGLK